MLQDGLFPCRHRLAAPSPEGRHKSHTPNKMRFNKARLAHNNKREDPVRGPKHDTAPPTYSGRGCLLTLKLGPLTLERDPKLSYPPIQVSDPRILGISLYLALRTRALHFDRASLFQHGRASSKCASSA